MAPDRDLDGSWLEARRKALGWSQARLAREFGTDQNTVSRWEQGKRAITLPKVVDLALTHLEHGRMLEIELQVGAEPVEIRLGPATLNAVARETPFEEITSAAKVWVYEAGGMPGEWVYGRNIDGRDRVLSTGLSTHYNNGLVAVVVPQESHWVPYEGKPVKFTFTVTPD